MLLTGFNCLNAVLESDTFHSQRHLSVTGQPSKLLYVMHNSETPLSCLALFEGGPCLIADANFDVLMVKLKSHFQNAKGHKVECRGSRYRYCDFLIKVGTVTMSSSARGISVEVCTHTLVWEESVEILLFLLHEILVCLIRWSTVPVWCQGTAGTSWRSSCSLFLAPVSLNFHLCLLPSQKVSSHQQTALTLWLSTWSCSTNFANCKFREVMFVEISVEIKRYFFNICFGV